MSFNENAMPRAYTLKRRAEQQAETRQRIVEAAVALHRSVGPAQTSYSMVAERAGVQRHTLYAHFPDERSLLMACSGLTLQQDPLPDESAWQSIARRPDRLRTGLAAVYAWYGRNHDLAACVLRDAEHHALTREIVSLRMAPRFAAYHAVLGEGLAADQQAVLHVALGFHCWHALVQESGLRLAAAVRLMVRTIEAAGRP